MHSQNKECRRSGHSFRSERCSQLQAEDVVVKGKTTGGINSLLHVSQISHDRVSDIATVLQHGDTLKAMILCHDRERGRVSLSTKKLEPTPGDMICNPKLVFEKAEEMAQTFRQRIAQAEAMARADMLRFQRKTGLTLSPDGILGPLTSDLPVEG